MLCANLGEDGKVSGEHIEDPAYCAAYCVVAGEEEELDLAHDELLKLAVHEARLVCHLC